MSDECDHDWKWTGQANCFDSSPWLLCSKCDAGKYDKRDDDIKPEDLLIQVDDER